MGLADVSSRFLYGGQISLLTGLAAAFLCSSLGFCGVMWGFGWVDGVLMRARSCSSRFRGSIFC